MEELLRSWLYSLLVSGCMCSLLCFVNADSKMKGLIETACVCVMLFICISPFRMISDFRSLTEDYIPNSSLELDYSDSEQYIKSFMEAEYSAYIRNEADRFGVTLTDVFVTTRADENGNQIPYEVFYKSEKPISPDFKTYIADKLGVMEERQFEDE